MKNKDQERQVIARRAIERLVEETFMYVNRLNNITERHPELVIPIARKQIVWPSFISRKSAFQQKNVKLINDIQLGNDFVLKGEWHPEDAPATHGAYWVHWWGTRMQEQWGLPKLTRKNKRKWFDKVWDCMLEDLQITPEVDPLLAPLGKSAERYYYKRADSKERMPLAVRAEIRRQIWKAFDTLIFRSK